jgi:tetratricopeptide (TPR) repeat protein
MAQFTVQSLLKAIKLAKLSDGHSLLNSAKALPTLSHAELPQDRLNVVLALFSQQRFAAVVTQVTSLAAEFPDAFILYNILGAANVRLGKMDEAIANIGKAIEIKPDYAEAHNSLGIALKDLGRLNEATASFSKALKFKPDFAEAHNNLGAVLKGQGRLEEAIASFGKALLVMPDFVDAHISLGIALQEQGRLEEAIASFGKALKIKPDNVGVYNNLGAALKGQGRLNEAVASFAKALQLKPEFVQAHNNLGVTLQDLGRLEEAVASFSKALQIKPGFAEAHNNLGIALQKQGHLEEAIASFNKALQLKSDYAEAHNNLGTALQERGRTADAIVSLNRAVVINPGFAQAHNNLGNALQEQGRFEDAISCYGKALEINPKYAGAHNNLCDLFEKQNRQIELELALEKATLYCGAENAEILFRHAQLSNLKKQHDVAIDYLNRVQVDKLHTLLKPQYFSLLGKTYDRLGQFKEAFSAFEKQNALTGVSEEAKKVDPDNYLSSVLLLKNTWKTDVKPAWSNAVAGRKQSTPTFLIGFPRSGTTLLDTILLSHSGIKVVEEKPMAEAMSRSLKRTQTVQNLNSLSEVNVRQLRDAYFEELKSHIDKDHYGKLLVDKHPLNIVRIGLIHRVFPDAKFILVLRHPCDCVLSCFMQTFKLNDAMANFLTLDTSAKLYAAVMELLSAFRQKLSLDMHVLKYEDLIQDFEGTCKPLIRYLGLEWDDNLRNYQETALNRITISTPSYNQVIQPLYNHASGRWTNYRKQMKPVLPVLRPWIEAFGY